MTPPTAGPRPVDARREQGHWLLARLGKTVLRPGGIELTRWLLDRLGVTDVDAVVELGPGVGRTATLVLERAPRSYVGVEPTDAARTRLDARLNDLYGSAGARRLVAADAAETGLVDGGATVVLGEALLTMQSDEQKRAIASEACRLLQSGGRFGIHELALVPDDLPAETQRAIGKQLGQSIKVGARPLTVPAWEQLLRDVGLEIAHVETAPMRLLEPTRLIRDEGLLGATRFVLNVLRDAPARRRVLAMRATFREHHTHLAAVAIVARRPAVDPPAVPTNGPPA